MTEHEQRVAIAEWMGYVVSHGGDFDGTHVAQGSTVMKMPDYTRDLNAMHEAELKLTVGGQWAHYYSHFVDAGGVTINATAAQRAEALLRTLGLWKETAP